MEKNASIIEAASAQIEKDKEKLQEQEEQLVEHQRQLNQIKAEEGAELMEKGGSVFDPKFSAFVESVPGSQGSATIRAEAKQFYEIIANINSNMAQETRSAPFDDDDMELEHFNVDTTALEDDLLPPELPREDAPPEVWVEYRAKHKEHETSRQANAKKRKAEAGKIKEVYGKLSVRKGGAFFKA